MATPPSILSTILSNVQTTTSTLRASMTTIRPLYNITSTITGRAVPMPAGITPGLFGFGILGLTPLGLQNMLALTRLQSLAQSGLNAPAGITLPY